MSKPNPGNSVEWTSKIGLLSLHFDTLQIMVGGDIKKKH